MLHRMCGNEKGFTMIEMMIVMVIIAVLVAGGVAFYQGNIERAKVTKARAQISTMQAALDTYYAENGKYPYEVDKLEADMLDAGLVVKENSTEGGHPEGCWALNVEDPWGKNYLYHPEEEGKAGQEYYIRTGWVEKDGENAVFGNGSEGLSEEPKVGEPTLPSVEGETS
ncbi:MAG: type II secretion system protein GspG [Candidatus Syntrophopropionicum ammoniitolerans]